MSRKYGSKCFRERDIVSFVIFLKFFKNPDFSVYCYDSRNEICFLEKKRNKLYFLNLNNYFPKPLLINKLIEI